MSSSSSSFSDLSNSSKSSCSGFDEISGEEQMSINDSEKNSNINTNYENTYAEINNNNPLSIETPECFTVDLPQGYKRFYVRPNRLIRDVSFFLDLIENQNDYEADSDDENFIDNFDLDISLERFEEVMDTFESIKPNRLFKMDTLCYNFNISKDKLDFMLHHWQLKNKQSDEKRKLPKDFVAFRQCQPKTPIILTRGAKRRETEEKVLLIKEALRTIERLKNTLAMLQHLLKSREKEFVNAQISLKMFEKKYKVLSEMKTQDDQDGTTFANAASRFVKYCPTPYRLFSDSD